MTKPALLLLPNVLGNVPHHELYLPVSVDRAIETLDGLIAESEKGARRYLARFKTEKKPHEIPVALLNEHTPENDIDFLLEPIRKGERWGLISDGGLPCIADPGAILVRRAHQTGIPVQAFSGPSSIFLALMLSGLPGQRFAFHGYLDKDPKKREAQIHALQKRSQAENATQICMETPYRNQALLDSFLRILHDETYLACAWDLTLPTQGLLSQPAAIWKKSPLPKLEKKSAIFLFWRK
jgi:16S rRNA (cytidine1402-2'-O)-methyltransferase